MGVRYARITAFILCCSIFLLMGCVPVLAAEWSLDSVYCEIDHQEGDLEDYSIASYSNASDSNAGIVLLSTHDIYDGTISSTYIQYARDMVAKLSPTVDYVFFRSGQYTYRLVYSEDLQLSGSRFTAASAEYVSWDSRNYTVSFGSESNFSLNAGNYMVYTDLVSPYPALVTGVISYAFEALLLLVATLLLFDVLRAFFSVRRYRF